MTNSGHDIMLTNSWENRINPPKIAPFKNVFQILMFLLKLCTTMMETPGSWFLINKTIFRILFVIYYVEIYSVD